MSRLRWACLCLVMAGNTAAAVPDGNRYSPGQVWEYQTRPQDNGSLLKIQQIEVGTDAARVGPIYHISIIGLHFAGVATDGTLQHAPFSQAALDSSVTRLTSANAIFPDASGGIAEWRKARGGVFTITVAKAVDFAEQTMRKQMPAQPSSD